MASDVLSDGGQGEVPFGARCGVHPEAGAVATCVRCGNYMCRQCVSPDGSGTCAACKARGAGVAFPYDRRNFDVGGIFNLAWTRFQEQWLMLCLAVVGLFAINTVIPQVVMVVIGALASAVGEPMLTSVCTAVVMIFFQIVAIGLQLGFMSMTVRVMEGRIVEVGELFGRFHRIVAAVAQMLVLYLPFLAIVGVFGAVGYLLVEELGVPLEIPVVVGALLLAPALIYVFLGLVFMQYEIAVFDGVAALEGIRNSWQISEGMRLWIFLSGLLFGILCFAGMLLCCVGLIPAMALGSLFMSGVYLALRSDLPPG